MGSLKGTTCPSWTKDDFPQIAKTSGCQVRGYLLHSNSSCLTITSNFSHWATLIYVMGVFRREHPFMATSGCPFKGLGVRVPGASAEGALFYFTYSPPDLNGYCIFSTVGIQWMCGCTGDSGAYSGHTALFSFLVSSLSCFSTMLGEPKLGNETTVTVAVGIPLCTNSLHKLCSKKKWLPNLLVSIWHCFKRQSEAIVQLNGIALV